MPSRGTVYKRCSCQDPETGRRWGSACPELSRRDHGSWSYQLRHPRTGRQLREGGYATRADAQRALDRLREELQQRRDRIAAPGITTGQWLEQWLAGKSGNGASVTGKELAATTARMYRFHLDLYLIPQIGRIPLTDLTADDIADAFAAIAAGNATRRRPLGPASTRRLYATLRAALNTAVKRQLIPNNPALFVELPSAPRPKALIWTSEREAAWRRTGKRPSPVMVWTPEQTGHFLTISADDPLYPLYHLVALRGLRRGEAVGLRWPNVDLDSGTVIIVEQTVQIGWRTGRTTPKAGSDRIVALDSWTTDVLRQHRARQAQQLAVLDLSPDEAGWVFTQADARPYHPGHVTRRFAELITAADLPPIRLHDLRHGAATLALAAGAELKVVQEMLGHSSLSITADTYTSVLPQVARAAAENVAGLIPRRRRTVNLSGTADQNGEDPDGAAASI